MGAAKSGCGFPWRRSWGGLGLKASSMTQLKTRPETSPNVSEQKDIVRSREEHIIEQQEVPLLSLPVEILQEISSYLEASSAASFSLSTRYVHYALGNQHLRTIVQTSSSVFEKRKNLEILERAFSSHYYCAWCDKFHEHELAGGPRNYPKETERDCHEYNSYLHAGKDYVLTFHHIKLALNRHLWGPSFGISLQDLCYRTSTIEKFKHHQISTALEINAKVVDSRLILHSTFSWTLPRAAISGSDFVTRLLALCPHIVKGHRDSKEGHTGLIAHVARTAQALSLGPRKPWLCAVCATDFLFAEHHLPSQHVEYRLQTWRDLGDGRNPFSVAWRAHGEIGGGIPGFGGDVIRLTMFRAGQIREAFEGEDDQIRANDDIISRNEGLVKGRLVQQIIVPRYRRPKMEVQVVGPEVQRQHLEYRDGRSTGEADIRDEAGRRRDGLYYV
ncbi:hypothetical protein P154DRAFT_527586 [Amniculicola lignicola CBS 123094]|uniref:F-box domain-containing protein n=1 Tax=Amniculicola lignicola CBS 123094 TaxID=1392246 RepID=A0A6A5VXV7_9PLEO|nr:hypothetical protein P154DRAFT_527586 [Amniculicola lignicola CBS 123094]